MERERLLRIGDLARETGKTVRALRYYEEFGLLEPTDHTKGGFRLYRPEDLKRVQLIERLQDLGFTLEKIREIVRVWRHGRRGEELALELRQFFEEGLRDIRSRLAKLREMETEMEEALRFLTSCQSCQDRPGREVCSACEKGDHKAHLPSLMDALARGR